MNNKVYYFVIDDIDDIDSISEIKEFEESTHIRIELSPGNILGFHFKEPGWQSYIRYDKVHIVVYRLDDYLKTNYENDRLKDLIKFVLNDFSLPSKRKNKIKRLL